MSSNASMMQSLYFSFIIIVAVAATTTQCHYDLMYPMLDTGFYVNNFSRE